MPEKETTNFKLPYPTSAGEVKAGATDFEELAVKVDTVLKEHVLIYKNRAASYEAKTGELGFQESTGKTVTLPSAATANQIIGVFAGTGVEAKITTTGGAFIFGDFLKAETATITLTEFQHVILQSGGGEWFIIAGEPKREQEYGIVTTYTKAEAEEAHTPSTTRPTRVLLSSAVACSLTITLGAHTRILENVLSIGFTSLPGGKWSANQAVKVVLIGG